MADGDLLWADLDQSSALAKAKPMINQLILDCHYPMCDGLCASLRGLCGLYSIDCIRGWVAMHLEGRLPKRRCAGYRSGAPSLELDMNWRGISSPCHTLRA